MLTKNSFLAYINKQNILDVGHLCQADPALELFYVKWESVDPTKYNIRSNKYGYGWSLDHIERTFLTSQKESNNNKSKIIHSEKELLEFRLKYG